MFDEQGFAQLTARFRLDVRFAGPRWLCQPELDLDLARFR